MSKQRVERRITWEQIAAFRMRRHWLMAGSGETASTAKDAKGAKYNREKRAGGAELAALVRELNGIQAQMMSAAELALRVRSSSATPEAISHALWQGRTLVKTSAMRQTLHLLPAADLPLYIAALRSSRMDALLRVMSRFGIKPTDVDSLNAAIVEALAAGPLTLRELAVSARKSAGKRMRSWLDAVWSNQQLRTAMVQGLICYGPERGRESTFLRVDHWLPRLKPVPGEKAKEILLERFLRAYGPATAKDFAFWSGMPKKEATPVWDSLAHRMAEVPIEGRKLFILAEDLAELRESGFEKPVVRLLPHFDVYLLAHAEKDHLIESRHYKSVYRNQGWISPVVLFNGRIIGTWSRENTKKPSVKAELFGNVPAVIQKLVKEQAALMVKL